MRIVLWLARGVRAPNWSAGDAEIGKVKDATNRKDLQAEARLLRRAWTARTPTERREFESRYSATKSRAVLTIDTKPHDSDDDECSDDLFDAAHSLSVEGRYMYAVGFEVYEHETLRDFEL